MKKIFLLCCASLQLGLYAQDVPVAAGEALPAEGLPAEVYSEEDPFADLFGEANDIVVESQDAPLPEPADGLATEHQDPFFKPLSFFGHLKAEAGVAGFYEDGTFDGTGLFLFKNEFGMTARASKYLGMKGTLVVQYPDFSLSVGSLYFDYLLLDKIYISGGKKPVNWGYILLFSDLSLFDFSIQKNWLEETEYVPTNILSDSEDNAAFSLGPKHILFEIGGATLICRLLEGDFLDWRRVVPTNCPVKLVAHVSDLASSVERVGLIVSEKYKSPVRCVFSHQELLMRTNTTIGAAEDRCSIAGDGKELEIGFNVRYLADALRAVPSEEVTLELTNGLSPIVLTPVDEKEDFAYMVLPVRLKSN